ncbi:MAG: TauD/TfdA dioxygenase family protein [Blastomonas fulva]|uniref:TauD/TfdA dioxygenase family protein n=1 Tax=Blastomonas TaxID=150203 RepID=UPI00083E4778|nr:TauD/TfdA family dioxygenase [Blastomonas sp. RAC04]AOG01787.1 taurine catabolism dioxygenase TauD, TfdA family protein [Blastomonas sp. RAC04]
MATASTTLTQLRHEALRPVIGSRVLNSKAELLSGELGPEIRELLEERGVLVFKQVNFTDEEQVAFTKTLGEFAPERMGDGENVSKITLDIKENPGAAEYLKGSLYWHIDGTMNDVPILASLLSCKVAAPKGTGNTGFCNTYAAWDALPEERKAELKDLRTIHGVWPTVFYYDPEPSLAKLKGMRSVGENELPLVWKHRSGRESLVIGCTTLTVLGKNHFESAEIIHGLREWATQEQFSYSHAWDEGDLVMWDNTGTMHRAEPYDLTCGRMMHRTKLKGEEPFA